MPTPVVVGRISGLFGTRGWLRVQSYTRPPENLIAYSPWLLPRDGGWHAYEVLEGRRHHGVLIAALAQVGDRNAARALVHQDIAVDRAQIGPPPPGEFLWVDLIGLDVETPAGERLGQVSGLLETAAHDVLRVVGADGRERLIPFVREVYVLDVDLARGRLLVDWHPDD